MAVRRLRVDEPGANHRGGAARRCLCRFLRGGRNGLRFSATHLGALCRLSLREQGRPGLATLPPGGGVSEKTYERGSGGRSNECVGGGRRCRPAQDALDHEAQTIPLPVCPRGGACGALGSRLRRWGRQGTSGFVRPRAVHDLLLPRLRREQRRLLQAPELQTQLEGPSLTASRPCRVRCAHHSSSSVVLDGRQRTLRRGWSAQRTLQCGRRARRRREVEPCRSMG